MKIFVTLIGTALALASAGYWFAAATRYVTREKEIAYRTKIANRTGEKPDLSGVSIGGMDMLGSLRQQSAFNAIAAVLAGAAVIFQTIAGFLR